MKLPLQIAYHGRRAEAPGVIKGVIGIVVKTCAFNSKFDNPLEMILSTAGGVGDAEAPNPAAARAAE